MIKKTILLILVFILGFLVGNVAKAADLNGYTAKYECKSGGEHCNVDVAALTAQACDQVITTATSPTGDWSAINWSNNVICLANGDHTGRGTLTLSSSGTSGAYKVLRGVCTDDPWNTSCASVQRIAGGGRNYWIIDRISLPSTQITEKVYFKTSESHIIISRILAEGFWGSSGSAIIIEGTTDLTVQNSVIRDCQASVGDSPTALSFGHTTNTRIVNNEMYDCAKGPTTWRTSGTEENATIENNDIYLTSTYYTDCSGNDDTGGNCSKGESLASTKGDGSASGPYKYIQNRMWGMKQSDVNVCCDGGGAPGNAVGIGGGDLTADYVLLQNNIIMDSGGGIQFTTLSGDGTDRTSVIGNTIYHLDAAWADNLGGIRYYASGGSAHDTSEVYLNTLIDAGSDIGWLDISGLTNSDIKCNVAISSPVAVGTLGSGSVMSYNAFYDTTASGTNTTYNAVTTRLNSTAYSLGQIIRTTATAPADGTAGDFLYEVTDAGTSAGSPPSYTTTLGATTTDGDMVVQAIRGPLSFYRKLRTGAELVYIPYALVHTTAPEYGACPSGFASTSGRGVDNTQP